MLDTIKKKFDLKNILLALFIVIFTCGFILLCSCNQQAKIKNSDVDLSKLELIKEGELNVAISTGFFPFEDSVEGKLEGIDVDLVDKIGKELGLKVKYDVMEFDDVIDCVKDKKCDIAISGISITDERRKKVSFTVPYYDDKNVIIANPKSDVTTENIDSLINTPGRKITVKAFTSNELYVDEHFPILTKDLSKNDLDCVNKLLGGSVDMYFAQKSLLDYWGYNQVRVVKELPEANECGICVSKDNLNLQQALNSVIKNMKNDGSLSEIINNWLN